MTWDETEAWLKDVLAGKAPLTPQNEAQRCYLQLVEALKVSNRKLPADPLEGQRTALHFTLLYLNARLAADGYEPSELLPPLVAIRDMLYEEAETAKTGRRARPSAQEDVRATATAAVSYLMEHGYPTETAHKFVEGEFAKAGHHLSRGAIYHWFRDHDAAGNGRARMRHRAHEHSLESLRRQGGRSDIEAARIVSMLIDLQIRNLTAVVRR